MMESLEKLKFNYIDQLNLLEETTMDLKKVKRRKREISTYPKSD